MSSLASRLDLATRTHAAARHFRLTGTRLRSAEALLLLVDEAEREMPGLRGLKRAELSRAVAAAVAELRVSVAETEPAKEMMS